MMLTSQTSIVIPAFNEAASIGPLVSALNGAASWQEVLVIDDGSTDETGDRASAAGARVIRHPQQRERRAVKTGSVRRRVDSF
jgi:glycosyltransferase involved in cell wall biosynthesis